MIQVCFSGTYNIGHLLMNAGELLQEVKNEDALTSQLYTTLDSEYAEVGLREPKVSDY